jgi:cell division protein FtsW
MKSDWLLFGTVVAMVGAGLVMIYSASSVVAQLNPRINSSFYYAAHQLIWAAVSFIASDVLQAARLPHAAEPRLGLRIARHGAVPATAGLLPRQQNAPLVPPARRRDAAALRIRQARADHFLRLLCYQKREAINSRRTIVAAALALAVLAATVGLGDLGTAIVLIVPAAVVFYVAGLERKFVLAALAVGALVAVGFVASKPYRMARIVGFFDPDYKYIDMVDPDGKIKKYISQSVTTRDAGYQVRQSKIAIGSGGPLGLGLMQGKQKILYLPEAHTDFIYAVVGEELGLWGCGAILAGFLVILWRGCNCIGWRTTTSGAIWRWA